MKAVKPRADKKHFRKANSQTRRQIKLKLLSLGYTLAAKALGFKSFNKFLNVAGDFPRALKLLKALTRGDTHHSTVRMIEALTLRKFVKRFRQTEVRGNSKKNGIRLEEFNMRKLVRKWGGVYRRVWRMKVRMEKKEGKKIKREELDDHRRSK